MSKFFNDGIITSFPQSLDAAGQFPRIKVYPVEVPGDNYTQVMRPDEISGAIGEAIRQYNLVRFNVDVPGAAVAVGQTTIPNFTGQSIQNLTDYVKDYINTAVNDALLSIYTNAGLDAVNFNINFFDILNVDTKIIPHGGNDVYAYRTYDIVIYGQYTPNPAAPAPAAPCLPLTGYEFRTAYNVSDPTKGNLYTDPGDLTFIYLELFPKGGGTGPNFNTASVIGYSELPSIAVGDYYTIRIEYDALLPGTQIPIKVKPQNQDLGYIYLNDTGATIYVLAQRLPSAGDPNIRIETFAQVPIAGENNPIISFQLSEASCASIA